MRNSTEDAPKIPIIILEASERTAKERFSQPADRPTLTLNSTSASDTKRTPKPSPEQPSAVSLNSSFEYLPVGNGSDGEASLFSDASQSWDTLDQRKIPGSYGPFEPSTGSRKCSKKQRKEKKLDKSSRQAAFNLTHPKEGRSNIRKTLYEQMTETMMSSLFGEAHPTITEHEVAERLRGPSGCATPQRPKKDGSESHLPTRVKTETQGKTSKALKATKEIAKGTLSLKQRRRDVIFTLDDFEAMIALQGLFVRYGGVSHMGILDRSYSFFVNKARTGGLYFKVHDKVAIVGGEPLCPPDQFDSVLGEFKAYRKKFRWGMAFLGASDTFVEYSRGQKWTSIQFGVERVLNPLNNPVLLEQTQKRMTTQNRQLLDPNRFAISLHVYSPWQGEDLDLQAELSGIYDAWRNNRDGVRSNSTQAFITVYDPFSLPYLMCYIYTRNSEGVANGFAALRKTGATNGFHIDPYIAAPGAPRGVSDLLISAAMALLKKAGIDSLSLGFEPLTELGAVYGLGGLHERLVRSIYKKTISQLPVQGKKQYHDKFRPDESKGSGLHLVFADKRPRRKHMVALAHTANIKISKVIFRGFGKVDILPARGAPSSSEAEHEQSE